MEKDIFGYSWDEICRRQQGEKIDKRVPNTSIAQHKAEIERDIVKFNLSVHRDVAAAYNITIPDNYELIGDIYKIKS